jgi:hypothetical protein
MIAMQPESVHNLFPMRIRPNERKLYIFGQRRMLAHKK